MGEQNIYKFLTAKCKEKSVKIEELPKLCGFSRSTLYRYMKGFLYMPPEVEKKFADVLELDDSERRQLSVLASLTAFDESMLRARHALDRFMFGAGPAIQEHHEIQLAYYDGDKYLRTAQEVFDKILAGADQPEYACEIRIVNCMRPQIFAGLSAFLQRLFQLCANARAEHLLSLSAEDHSENITALLSLVPLLNYMQYRVRYKKEKQNTPGKAGLFHDCVFLSVRRKTHMEYYMLSFLADQLSECFVTRNQFWYEFILGNYQELRVSYTGILCDHTAPDAGEPDAGESASCCYALKYDICFTSLPGSVRDMMRRAPGSEETDAGLFCRLADAAGQEPRIHVHSAAGLAHFAATGAAQGQPQQLMPLSRETRLEILTFLLSCINAKSPPFTLLLTRKPLLENGYMVAVSKGQSACLVYPPAERGPRRTPLVFVPNKELAGIFADYVESHLPMELTLSPQEAAAFLEEQIDRLRRSGVRKEPVAK